MSMSTDLDERPAHDAGNRCQRSYGASAAELTTRHGAEERLAAALLQLERRPA